MSTRTEQLLPWIVGALLLISLWSDGHDSHPDKPDQGGTDNAIVTAVSNSLSNASNVDRQRIHGVHQSLATWVETRPPQSTGDLMSVAKQALVISGWTRDRYPKFDDAYQSAWESHDLSRPRPIADVKSEVLLVLHSIAVGAR